MEPGECRSVCHGVGGMSLPLPWTLPIPMTQANRRTGASNMIPSIKRGYLWHSSHLRCWQIEWEILLSSEFIITWVCYILNATQCALKLKWNCLHLALSERLVYKSPVPRSSVLMAIWNSNVTGWGRGAGKIRILYSTMSALKWETWVGGGF